MDRARQRRQVFAARYGIEATYDTVDELLVREVPDIVSAILPTAYTYDAVIACAEAGVRVVSCEKPIAAELARADAMVSVCRARGTALGCGTGHWNAPYLQQTVEWIRAGNIGPLTAAAIPRGLAVEASGGGCAALTQMRFVTGMEVEWVEGWTLPPKPGYRAPEAVLDTQADCPAWGYRAASSARSANRRTHRETCVPLRSAVQRARCGSRPRSRSWCRERAPKRPRFFLNFSPRPSPPTSSCR